MMNVLFPAAGGEPVISAIKYLKKSIPKGFSLKIVASDADSNKQAVLDADVFVQSPTRTDPNYIDFLLSLCKKEQINLVIPNPVEEQIFLHPYLPNFEAIGAFLVVSPLKALKLFDNKEHTYQFAQKIGVPSPQYTVPKRWDDIDNLAKNLGYPKVPVMIRITTGKGAMGIVVISENVSNFFSQSFQSKFTINLESFKALAQKLPPPQDIIICEYLPGREYDVDCFRSKKGDIITCIRENLQMIGGSSVVAKIVDNEKLSVFSKKILEQVEWTGIASVSFKEDNTGEAKLIEVNPRMPSCIGLTCEAGMNFPWWLIKSYTDPTETFVYNPLNEKESLTVVRFFEDRFLKHNPKS